MNLLTLIVTEVFFGKKPASMAVTYHYLLDDIAIAAFDRYQGSIYNFLHDDSGNGSLWEDVLPNFVNYQALSTYLTDHNIKINAERAELAPAGVKSIYWD